MHPVWILRALTGLTQADLASAAGTSQPTIAAYEGGRKSPTLETLSRLAEAAGLPMTVTFHPPLTREERRSLHLHAVIAGRLERDPATTLRTARRNLEFMSDRHPHAERLFEEWDTLLGRAVRELEATLVDPSPRARELRHVTPFAGVLSAPERAQVYREFVAAESRR